VLVQGLRDTALAEPADPIDYFAKWLLHRRDVEGQWTEFREKAEYLANLEAELRRLEAERLARQEEERRQRSCARARKRSGMSRSRLGRRRRSTRPQFPANL
jgi:hypothetical protein